MKSKQEVLSIIGRFMQFYRENGKWLERTYDFVPRIGIDRLREILVDDKDGICGRLDREIQESIDAFVDPWTEADAPAYAGQFDRARTICLPVLSG